MRLRHILVPVVIAAAGVMTLDGAASAAPTKVGVETFTLTGDINTEGGPVTASGVINDTGVDIVVSDTQDTFDFGANGQITVFHSPVRQRDHFNEKKCSLSFTETGTYVFGNGAGEWANYNGSGTYTFEVHITDACNDTPVGTFTITAKGPINLSTNG
jgi:hypothetical protein